MERFWETVDAIPYVDELSLITGKPRNELVQAKRGNGGGTWAHPKLAVFYARWLDVKFAVFCDAVIDDILNKKAELTITKPEEQLGRAMSPVCVTSCGSTSASTSTKSSSQKSPRKFSNDQPDHLQLQYLADPCAEA
ncbi:MAG: KilA-N domain-containing protein [Gammaproteobacteria bacterium]|nr:KilA-N domain-containing protein [Gammaproteobacteria bacterium]MBU1804143.1 KilA-N domain-containing protein [Gammaproteobacteria bacterium]